MKNDPETLGSGSISGAARRWAAMEAGAPVADALALFDSLPPVRLEDILGAWRGRGLPTGHPLDGVLERAGWHGKRFGGVDDVDPLVFDDGHGGFLCVNPALIPMGLMRRAPRLVNTPVTMPIFRIVRPLLRTRKPAARLRMMEHRGVLTAAMIYDALPINDVFRRVDDTTLLGLMDMRGLEQPFLFSLRREDVSATT